MENERTLLIKIKTWRWLPIICDDSTFFPWKFCGNFRINHVQ
jgi:hypothetical protein